MFSGLRIDDDVTSQAVSGGKSVLAVDVDDAAAAYAASLLGEQPGEIGGRRRRAAIPHGAGLVEDAKELGTDDVRGTLSARKRARRPIAEVIREPRAPDTTAAGACVCRSARISQ